MQRFRALVAAGPGGRAVIVVPFDPDAVWGAKAEHPVGGSIDGTRVRGTIAPNGSRWAFTLSPMRLRGAGVAALAQPPVVQQRPGLGVTCAQPAPPPVPASPPAGPGPRPWGP